MRGSAKTFLAFLFLVSFPPMPGGTVTGHAEAAGESLLPGRHEASTLAVIAGLPDGDIPIGKTLILASAFGRERLDGETIDPDAVEKEIDRLAGKVRPALLDRSDPRKVVSALNRFLFDEEGFTYDCAAGNPDNYLLDRVIARRRGNCLGLTAMYLVLAERLSLPLHGVYVPSHCFVRYEDAGVRFNIETGEKGADRGDGRYVRDFGLAEDRPYLQSLGRKEMIGVYLKSLGAAFSRKGMEVEALGLYREAAAFYPGLPDIHFNAGVSSQKMGRLDEAIARYRRAVDLDPGLAVARDNLGVALARKGLFVEALTEARKATALAPRNAVSRGNLAATLCACGMLEEGIREFRKVLEIDPGNPRALAGLVNTHYARGEIREALRYCDRAVEAGCRLDPSLLAILEARRSRPADPGP